MSQPDVASGDLTRGPDNPIGLDALPDFVLDVSNADFAVATRGPVCLYHWRGACVPAALPYFEVSLDRAAEASGRKWSLLYGYVDDGGAFPDSEMRSGMARLFRQRAHHVRASALVFEGSGFRRAAVRNVMVAVSLLARQGFPHRIFSSVDEAAGWLTEESVRRGGYTPGLSRSSGSPSAPTTIDPAWLTAALDHLRRTPAADERRRAPTQGASP